ncbi:hypothetical protein [Phenylobacterium sp.]|uniref:hypothetical protein n=1 Tax=Phenylobacterium sp. TaxID=1871053 RepID=UPI0035B05E18
MSDRHYRFIGAYLGARMAGANSRDAGRIGLFFWIASYWKEILSVVMVLAVLGSFVPYFEGHKSTQSNAASVGASEAASEDDGG